MRCSAIEKFLRCSISCIALFNLSGEVGAQSLGNASFETPTVASNTDSLRPTGGTWTFSGQAGIRNQSAPNGSSGKQVAFLSAAPSGGNNNFGSISQSISFAPGTYYVRYLSAIKTPSGRPQPVRLSIDGVAIGGLLNQRYITDTTTGGFEAGWTVPFVVTAAGTHELKFEATNATNYGTTASPAYGVAYLDAITIVSAVGAFANSGFEAATGWTFAAGATRTATTNAPEGATVLSLASGASASQSVSLGAGRYSISLKAGKASATTASVRVDVASNGAAAATVATIVATIADEYRSFSTAGFALPAGTHVVTFTALGGSVNVDNIAINDAGPEAANSTFESPSLAAPTSATAAGPTVANPTNASWAFSGTGGAIQGNAGSSNNSAPRTIYGKQYLALSSTGKVTQSLAFEGGIYIAVGQIAQGGVTVSVDGVVVARLSASTLDFREVASPAFAIASGSRSVALAVDSSYSPATPKVDEFRLQRIDLPPVVAITAPANGTVFSTGATVNVTATAADADGLSSLVISRTPSGGSETQIASGTTSPLSTSWTNASANTYTIKATATDATGTIGTSTVTIRVNANPSVILSMSPAGPVVTSTTAVSVTATAGSVTDSDGSVTKVEFLLDGSVAASCTKTIPPATAPFTCAHSLSPRATTYALAVRVTDNDGGVTTTAPLSMRINTAPAVTLAASCVAPCSGPATVNLTATPTDSDGTIAKVEFYDGATLLATKTVAPWTYAHTNVANATHSYTAKAFDNDNASTTSAAAVVTVAVPTASVALSATCTAPCNAPAAVTLTATPANISGTISKVEFYDGATLLSTDTTSPYSYAASSVTAATHSYVAKVYVTGNSTAVATSTAQAIRVNALPSVTLSASCVAPCNDPATVNLTATPADTDGTISKVEFYDGANLIATKTASPWIATHTSVATGSHTYAAKVFDNDGASATSSSTTVNVTSPKPPSTTTLSFAATGVGTAVKFTAYVTPSDATGTVSFVEGATSRCANVALATNSQGRYAECVVNNVTNSSTARTFTANYSGDASLAPSSASATWKVTPLITAVASVTTVVPGQAFTVTATVTPAAVTGTLDFLLEYSDVICAGVALVGTTTKTATCTIPASRVTGDLVNIRVLYSGNASFESNFVDISVAAAVSQAAPRLARQSSTDGANPASLAISTTASSPSRTLVEAQPWWEVDLDGKYTLDRIVITPSSSCGSLQLRDAALYATSKAIPLLVGAELATHKLYEAYDASIPLVWSGTGDIVVTDVAGRDARFIRIWDKATTALCLDKVKVYVKGNPVGVLLENLNPGRSGTLSTVRATVRFPDFWSVTLSSVDLFANSTKIATATAAPYDFSLAALPPGDYVLRAKANFSGGSPPMWSEPVVVGKTDASTPPVSIAEPTVADPSYSYGEGLPDRLSFSGTYRANPGDTLQYRLDEAPCCGSQPWSPLTMTPDGTYRGYSEIPLTHSLYEARSFRLSIRLLNADAVVYETQRDFSIERPSWSFVVPDKLEVTGNTLDLDAVVRAYPWSDFDRSVAPTHAAVVLNADGSWRVRAEGTFPTGTNSPLAGLSIATTDWDRLHYHWDKSSVYQPPVGFFRLNAYLSQLTGMYRGIDKFSGTESAPFRWGNLAPVPAVLTPPVSPMYIGSPARLFARIADYDDTRMPPLDKVVFSVAGGGTATASYCGRELDEGYQDPAVLRESYAHVCYSNPIAIPTSQPTASVTVSYTDRTGNSGTSAAQPVSVAPLIVSIASPQDGEALPTMLMPHDYGAGNQYTISSDWVRDPPYVPGDYQWSVPWKFEGCTPLPQWPGPNANPSICYPTQSTYRTVSIDGGVFTGASQPLSMGEGSLYSWQPLLKYGVQPVPPGQHTMVVRMVSPSGGVAESAPRHFTAVENQWPSVQIASPAAGATLSTLSPTDVRIAARDPDGTITRVTLLVNGGEVASTTTEPFVVAWTPPTEAYPIYLSAVATDNRGAQSISPEVIVRSSSSVFVPPSIFLSGSGGDAGFALGSVVAGRACFFPAITVDPTDRLISTVATIDGIALGAPFGEYCLPANTALGNHRVDVNVVTQRATGSATWNFIVEDFAAKLTGFPRSAYFSDYRAEVIGSSVPVAVSVTGSVGIARAFFAEIRHTGSGLSLNWLDSHIEMKSWTQPPYVGEFTVGTDTLFRRITAGCAVSTKGIRDCDYAYPYDAARAGDSATVTLTGPTNVAVATAARFTVTASPNASTTIARIGLFDAQTREKLGEVVGTGPANFDIAFTQSGTRNIIAAVQSTGALLESTLPPEYQSNQLQVRVGNAAPVVVVNAPVANDLYASNATIPLKITTSDSDGTVTSVQARIDGGAWATLPAPSANGSIDAVLDSPTFAAWSRSTGDHLLEVKAIDDTGGVTVVSVPFKLGNPFSGSLVRPDLFDNSLLGTPIPLRANGLINGVAPASIAYYANGVLVGSSAQAPFVVIWRPAAAGTYTITARATGADAAIYLSAPAVIRVPSAPVASVTGAALANVASIAGTVQAPAGSTVRVAGMPATYDPQSGQFFTSLLTVPQGNSSLPIEIVTPDGQRFTPNVNVVGTGQSGLFLVDISPRQGEAPFDVALKVQRTSSGIAVPSARITCDLNGAPAVTRTVSIDQVAILAGTTISTCRVDTPGVRVLQVEFLDGQGNVVETHRRQVLARAPVTQATAMLTTYFSFLTLLLDNKLSQAVQLGIIDGSRDQTLATLSAISSARLNEYAIAMFDVREIRIFGDTAEVIVALPNSTSGVDYYSVQFNVDLAGFWRIEGL